MLHHFLPRNTALTSSAALTRVQTQSPAKLKTTSERGATLCHTPERRNTKPLSNSSVPAAVINDKNPVPGKDAYGFRSLHHLVLQTMRLEKLWLRHV